MSYWIKRKQSIYSLDNHITLFRPFNSTRLSDEDTAPSPTKKDSIARRHTDNYGTQFIVKDDFKPYLTPCRWNETGWKYGTQNSSYFGHENKVQNTIGLSGHKLNKSREHKGSFKTQYMRDFKDKFEKNDDSKLDLYSVN